ncbi:MAG: SH3 domain-containing protein [Micavibrio sp.]
MGKKIILSVFCFFVFLAAPAMAQDGPRTVAAPSQGTLAVDGSDEAAGTGGAAARGRKANSSGLPIPRFVSLASDKVFVRTGPALRYPIKWVYQRKNMPVEIVQEFDTWRKIRDMDGDDGWIHQSLLSGERHIVVKGEARLPVRRAPDADSRPIAHLEPSVIARAHRCQGGWCQVMAAGYTGWAERKFLWGVYDSEDFD